MRFHLPSFLIGFGTATVLMGTRAALRPAFVELAALGVHIGRIGRALLARQRENVEDLMAEIEESARRRARGAHREPAPRRAAAPVPAPAETH